jgi:hypothetical protein
MSLVAAAIKRDSTVNPNHFSCHRHFSPSSLRSPSPHSPRFLALAQTPSQQWLPHTRTCFKRLLWMKVRFVSSSQTTFSRTVPCCNGVLPPTKIFLHPIQMRLWCFPLSSNANLASRPVTFTVNSSITIRLN